MNIYSKQRQQRIPSSGTEGMTQSQIEEAKIQEQSDTRARIRCCLAHCFLECAEVLQCDLYMILHG